MIVDNKGICETRVEVGIIGEPPTPEQLRTIALPETVVVSLSKSCNLWCQHCFYPQLASTTGKKMKNKFINMSDFELVANEMSGWNNNVVLRVVSDGEALLHPKCLDMIDYAKSKNITTCLTTNGILLTESTIDKLLKSNIDTIDISIDAATPVGYGKVRQSRNGVNHYEKVEVNVRNLIAARASRLPDCKTTIIVNMIDQPLTTDEVELFKKKWKEYKADVVLIRPYHSTSNNTPRDGVVSFQTSTQRFPCKYPFTRINVGFNDHGETLIYYCSHDWEDKTVVGILGQDGSMREIWNGARMETIRRNHIQNSFPADAFCKNCPDWYLGWGKSHHQLVNDLKK